ncbi:MAG: ATP synthase F1 subunit delta [Planctomycetota bacterium]|nr:ATP synthase F1 subunit delta [Planctomycetota bacterium]
MASKGTGNLHYVYAEALYDVAFEAGVLVRVEEEMLAVQDMLGKHPVIHRFLETPTIMAEQKRAVLLEALKELHPITLNFFCVLVAKQRVRLLDKIVDAFHEHCNDKAGIAEMTVTSAQPLDPGQRAKLAEVLERKMGRKVKLVEKVRRELIGGFVVTHLDQQWDLSLVHRLGRLVDRMETAREALGVWKD